MTASLLKRKTPVADLVFNALLQATNQSVSYADSLLLPRNLALNGGRGSVTTLEEECGYNLLPTMQDYLYLYSRGGIATRVVNIWPDESWSAYPELYESEGKKKTRFEKAWDKLSRKVLPWHYLHRADRLSGVGRFGILLMGLGDGRLLEEPAPNINPKDGTPLENPKALELLYLRAFDESQVEIAEWEDDFNNPRYGQPTIYSITFPNVAGQASNPNNTPVGVQGRVHWSRVVHLADNCGTSVIYGTPRMESVLNLLSDIHKVQGGSAEMFWKGGFPGYAFEAFPNELGILDVDMPKIRKEIDQYTAGLKRYLTSVGGKWNSLAVQVANPASHIQQYVGLMCSSIGVPMRIFLGTESGHLASTQDSAMWKERLRGRQTNYLEPMVVRPFVDRLMALGVLPRVEDYLISWRDLRALSDLERADVALKQVQALMQFVSGGVNQVLPAHMLLTMVMGFTDVQAAAIEKELVNNPAPILTTPSSIGSQSGERKGNAAASKGGKPKDTALEGQPRPTKVKTKAKKT